MKAKVLVALCVSFLPHTSASSVSNSTFAKEAALAFGNDSNTKGARGFLSPRTASAGEKQVMQASPVLNQGLYAAGDDGKDTANAISAGGNAVAALIRSVKSKAFDAKTAGDLMGSISTLVPFAMPPPAGFVCGAVLGSTGGVMSLLGPTAPTTQTLLDAMDKGFEQVNKELQGIGIKVDSLEKSIDELKLELDQVRTMAEELKLGYREINGILSAHSHLNELQKAGRTSETEKKEYLAQLKLRRRDLAMELENPGGVVSPANVDRAMAWIEDDCAAGDFFKLMYSARYALHKIIFMDDWISAGKLADKTKVESERANLTMRNLQKLHGDMKKFKKAVTDHRSEEALLRWSVGGGDACKSPCLGSSCTVGLTVESRPTKHLDFAFGEPKEGPLPYLNAIEPSSSSKTDKKKEKKYDGTAVYIQPAYCGGVKSKSRYVTTNPCDHFDFPALCIQVGPPIPPGVMHSRGVVWRPCKNVPDDEKVFLSKDNELESKKEGTCLNVGGQSDIYVMKGTCGTKWTAHDL